MRVAIVTESFLPVVNGVSNSVAHVVEHLSDNGHTALVIAPGDGPSSHRGVPVVRLPTVDLPVVDSVPIGVPSRRIVGALRKFGPDVVHLASPFVVGARGMAAARKLRVPTVAVYQTDVAGFASCYGLRLTASAAWRWTRRIHNAADLTLAPTTAAVRDLEAHGISRVRLWPPRRGHRSFHAGTTVTAVAAADARRSPTAGGLRRPARPREADTPPGQPA